MTEQPESIFTVYTPRLLQVPENGAIVWPP
jgi:hypothetical protein